MQPLPRTQYFSDLYGVFVAALLTGFYCYYAPWIPPHWPYNSTLGRAWYASRGGLNRAATPELWALGDHHVRHAVVCFFYFIFFYFHYCFDWFIKSLSPSYPFPAPLAHSREGPGHWYCISECPKCLLTTDAFSPSRIDLRLINLLIWSQLFATTSHRLTHVLGNTRRGAALENQTWNWV